MRFASRPWLLVPGMVLLLHCAQGTTLGELTASGGPGGAGGAGGDRATVSTSPSTTSGGDTTDTSSSDTTSGGNNTTSSSSGGGNTTASTTSGGGGNTSSTSGGGSTSSTTASTTASTTSATSTTATTTSSTTATTTSSTTSSTSTGGGTNCDPTAPGPVCGAQEHCFPQPNGTPICMGPTGAGAAYASCASPSDCKPALQCVDTGDIFGLPCCLKWCNATTNCGAGNTCTYLSPAVYVGTVEYGVCFDGLGGC